MTIAEWKDGLRARHDILLAPGGRTWMTKAPPPPGCDVEVVRRDPITQTFLDLAENELVTHVEPGALFVRLCDRDNAYAALPWVFADMTDADIIAELWP